MLLGLWTQGSAAGAAGDASEFINVERLSARVMVAHWVGMDRWCNLTAIRTTKGLVVIDTEMSPRTMAPIKELFEHAFGRSNWVYVISTHGHDTHAGGTSLFKGATVVGHDNLAEDMQWIVRRQTDPGWRSRDLGRAEQHMQTLEAGLPQVAARSAAEARLVRAEHKFWELHCQDLREGYPVVKPSLTFSDRCTLDLGDVQVRLVFYGKGHSSSDTLIYVPQERLLVTGGAVPRAHFPEISERCALDDVRRSLAVLNQFLALGVQLDHVVPGHGPPLVKQDLALLRDYYQKMLAGVAAAQREHLSLDQVQARLAADRFPALQEAPPGGTHERNVRNLWRLLQDKQ
jgi:glyoxylase-like metal-dependent hydrolase (beta-lactamase superfamily II)